MIDYIIYGLITVAGGLVFVKYKNGYRWEDLISPTKWRMVALWMLQKIQDWIDPTGKENLNLSQAELLQVANRVLMCEDCVLAGKCKNCGCEIGGLMSNKNASCADLKWGPMMTDEELIEYLKDTNYNIHKNQLNNGDI